MMPRSFVRSKEHRNFASTCNNLTLLLSFARFSLRFPNPHFLRACRVVIAPSAGETVPPFARRGAAISQVRTHRVIEPRSSFRRCQSACAAETGRPPSFLYLLMMRILQEVRGSWGGWFSKKLSSTEQHRPYKLRNLSLSP